VIADAREAEPVGGALGFPITEGMLFPLAPHVCIKLRGLEPSARKRKQIARDAIASWVINSDPSSEQGEILEESPEMAFALCYLATHVVLDLIEPEDADRILRYCERHLGRARRRR